MTADTMVDFARLRADIIEAAVIAVNGTLNEGLLRAQKDVPVRQVFTGGRQTVRFKTAEEIERDKGMRERLGLAPERLATPEAVARVRAAGLDPLRGNFQSGAARQGPVLPRSRADYRARLPREEEGFARTVSFPARGTRTNAAGLTRAQRGLVENRANRASGLPNIITNSEQLFESDRLVRVGGQGGKNRLGPRIDPATPGGSPEYPAEYALSSRGKYELNKGRAFMRHKAVTEVSINARTGEIGQPTQFGHSRVTHLGGGLRDTIRVVRATSKSYPIIEGWLLAGDRDHQYAKYQELGTRHNPAHPFLRPRLPEWEEELPMQLRRSLGRTGR